MLFETLEIFDYFIIIILIISMFFSFLKGFTQSLLGLLTWIGAAILTIIFQENLAEIIGKSIDQIDFINTKLSMIIARILSIPFIFLLSLIILRKIKSLISSDFQKSSLGNFWDKIFGAAYGFIFGFIVLSLLLLVINNIFSRFKSTKFIEESIIYPHIENFTNDYLIEYTPLIIKNSEEIIEENIE